MFREKQRVPETFQEHVGTSCFVLFGHVLHGYSAGFFSSFFIYIILYTTTTTTVPETQQVKSKNALSLQSKYPTGRNFLVAREQANPHVPKFFPKKGHFVLRTH
jgi:hypothetical protein